MNPTNPISVECIGTLHAVQPDALTIRITDDLQPGGARGNYTKAWPGGVVRPLMPWSFDFEPLSNKETGADHIKNKVDIR